MQLLIAIALVATINVVVLLCRFRQRRAEHRLIIERLRAYRIP